MMIFAVLLTILGGIVGYIIGKAWGMSYMERHIIKYIMASPAFEDSHIEVFKEAMNNVFTEEKKSR